MLVHKFYLIAWLELDSNLFEFNRFEFEFGKEKGEGTLSLPLGPVPLPVARSSLPTLSPAWPASSSPLADVWAPVVSPSPQPPARTACPPPLFPSPKARVASPFLSPPPSWAERLPRPKPATPRSLPLLSLTRWPYRLGSSSSSHRSLLRSPAPPRPLLCTLGPLHRAAPDPSPHASLAHA
jgi:hypothetical protein